MSGLSMKERLRVMEMVTEIASEAAKNPNVVWTIEFQEQLVESLYNSMMALLEQDEWDDEEEEEDEEDE